MRSFELREAGSQSWLQLCLKINFLRRVKARDLDIKHDRKFRYVKNCSPLTGQMAKKNSVY